MSDDHILACIRVNMMAYIDGIQRAKSLKEVYEILPKLNKFMDEYKVLVGSSSVHDDALTTKGDLNKLEDLERKFQALSVEHGEASRRIEELEKGLSALCDKHKNLDMKKQEKESDDDIKKEADARQKEADAREKEYKEAAVAHYNLMKKGGGVHLIHPRLGPYVNLKNN